MNRTKPNFVSNKRLTDRARLLSALCCRVDIEELEDQSERQEIHLDLVNWLDEFHVLHEAEASEKNVVLAPLGTLGQEKVRDISWRAEGLSVLLGCAGLREWAPIDAQQSAYDLAESIGFMTNEPTSLTLVSENRIVQLELDLARVHARLRAYLHQNQVFDVEGRRFDSWFANVTSVRVEKIDGDLAIRGERIDRAPQQLVRECNSIVVERRVAVQWVLGLHRLYSQITTDT